MYLLIDAGVKNVWVFKRRAVYPSLTMPQAFRLTYPLLNDFNALHKFLENVFLRVLQ